MPKKDDRVRDIRLFKMTMILSHSLVFFLTLSPIFLILSLSRFLLSLSHSISISLFYILFLSLIFSLFHSLSLFISLSLRIRANFIGVHQSPLHPNYLQDECFSSRRRVPVICVCEYSLLVYVVTVFV